MTHVLITGANGFIGKALCTELLRRDFQVSAAVRSLKSAALPPELTQIVVGDIDGGTDWTEALQGIDVVVHLAARVHVMRDASADPLAEFRNVNVAGTLNLARQAANAGARRFIFISSIKVNGESTQPGKPYTADDQPAPVDPYGISKREAEDALRALASATAMLDVVIIRPPLVYGAGVKANFQAMVRWLDRGVPLPLGAVHNRRSLLAVENLVDLIRACIHHPSAANQIFLAADGEDLSTTDLLRRTAAALGKSARLLPVPMWLLTGCAGLVGKSALAQRLCGSLQVDIGKTRDLLGWTPPVSVDKALVDTVQHYRKFRKC